MFVCASFLHVCVGVCVCVVIACVQLVCVGSEVLAEAEDPPLAQVFGRWRVTESRRFLLVLLSFG